MKRLLIALVAAGGAAYLWRRRQASTPTRPWRSPAAEAPPSSAPPKLGGEVDAELLAILACPLDKQPVTREGNYLVCQECQRHYPIRDGIPVMLIDEALTPEQAASATSSRRRALSARSRNPQVSARRRGFSAKQRLCDVHNERLRFWTPGTVSSGAPQKYSASHGHGRPHHAGFARQFLCACRLLDHRAARALSPRRHLNPPKPPQRRVTTNLGKEQPTRCLPK